MKINASKRITTTTVTPIPPRFKAVVNSAGGGPACALAIISFARRSAFMKEGTDNHGNKVGNQAEC